MRALFYFLRSFRFLNTTAIPSTAPSFVGDNGAIFQPPEIETVPDAELPEIAPVETEVLLDWATDVAEGMAFETEAMSASGASVNIVSILIIIAIIVGILVALAVLAAIVAAAILIPVLIVRSKKKKAAAKGTAATKG